MKKVNSLSFVLETNPTGLELVHKYIDVPCHDTDTNAHTHYFVAAAVRALIFSDDSGLFRDSLTKAFKFDHLRVTCDNALVNRFTVQTWNIVEDISGMIVDIIPGVENHGECMVDAHKGALAPKIRRLDAQDQYPQTDADVKAFFLNDEEYHLHSSR